MKSDEMDLLNKIKLKRTLLKLNLRAMPVFLYAEMDVPIY